VGELKSLSQVASPWGISNKAFVMIDELGGEANYQVALQVIYKLLKAAIYNNLSFIERKANIFTQ
jgi:hypothetical protein